MDTNTKLRKLESHLGKLDKWINTGLEYFIDPKNSENSHWRKVWKGGERPFELSDFKELPKFRDQCPCSTNIQQYSLTMNVDTKSWVCRE